jgi:hypothetical protein
MGIDEKLIEKVYNILHPRDITEAINYMIKEKNLYNHPFVYGKINNSLCLICNEPMRNHSLIRFRSIVKFSKFRTVILNDDN